MRRFTRRRWLFLAVMACGLLATGGYWSLRFKPGITVAAYDRIREGMTREQVEVIFGQPAEIETRKPNALKPPEVVGRFWAADHWIISVTFDGDEKVVRKGICDIRDQDTRSWLEKLRSQLGL